MEPPTALPKALIQTEHDLAHFLLSPGCLGYLDWLDAISHALVGHVAWDPTSASPAVERVIAMLEKLERLIDDHPPLTTSQRFGNLAFRTWSTAMLSSLPELVAEVVEPSHQAYLPHLLPLLVESSPFGNATRLDYGTGHELAFFLFLYALRVIGLLQDNDARAVGLGVAHRYLKLVWKLQDVYRLEPAGSHGVWGLDDYGFLGYLFGSAQLLSSSTTPADFLPKSKTPRSLTRLRDPALECSSVPPATGGSAVAREEGRGADVNLWDLSMKRVDKLKSGPWSEHSPLLYSLSTQVEKGWPKIHQGLGKMYRAEVLGKLVVVRSLRVGGLIAWE